MNAQNPLELGESRKLELGQLITRTPVIGIDIDGTLSDTI